MSTDPLFRPEDEKLIRDLTGATDKQSSTTERLLLSTVASNIAGGIMRGIADPDPRYEEQAVGTAVRMARAILKEVDRGE